MVRHIQDERPFALESDAARDIPGHDLLTAEEAAAFLGIDGKQLEPLAKQYGIARRYRTHPRTGWFYYRPDLQDIREALRTSAPAPEAGG